MKVYVTQEQIDTKNHSAFSCPIANATHEATENNFELVSVNGSAITLYDWDGQHYKYLSLPAPMQIWLGAYDGNEQVEPFSFDIDLENLTITNIEGI